MPQQIPVDKNGNISLNRCGPSQIDCENNQLPLHAITENRKFLIGELRKTRNTNPPYHLILASTIMLSNSDLLVVLILTIVLIIGFYQFYFWCQRNPQRKPVEFHFSIDHRIPLKPGWVWIYSFLYYPAIISMIFVFHDFRHFGYVVVNFFILLLMHMVFFVYYPVKTPEDWRDTALRKPTLSMRFLRFLQKMDQSSNCFPSMHVSVSMLTSYHLYANKPHLGFGVFFFPILIAMSAAYTKQHYLLDLLAGALMGCLAWKLFFLIY